MCVCVDTSYMHPYYVTDLEFQLPIHIVERAPGVMYIYLDICTVNTHISIHIYIYVCVCVCV